MKPVLLFIGVIALTLTGCLRVLHVNSDDNHSLVRLNEHAAEISATITFRDGESITVTQLHVRPDSATWTSIDSVSRGSIATSRIERVKIKQKPREVVPLGALIGGAAGGLWSYNNSEGTWYRAQVVGTITILGAAAGWGITSAIVGPRRELYKLIERDNTATSLPCSSQPPDL